MKARKVILCIDACEDDLSVMTFLLELSHYRAVRAISREQAIEAVKNQHVDLVIAAYQMPGTSGIQIIDLLKEIAPWVPMILYGRPPASSNQLCLADVVVVRNINPVDLLVHVNRLSARKRGPRKKVEAVTNG